MFTSDQSCFFCNAFFRNQLLSFMLKRQNKNSIFNCLKKDIHNDYFLTHSISQLLHLLAFVKKALISYFYYLCCGFLN